MSATASDGVTRISRSAAPVVAPPARRDAAFLALAAAFAVYGVAFILRTSFVLDGERWFTLFDDAMVSMRYARNLAEGHGLVWNPGGERVEGITNPLWTLWMAGLHLLPLPEAKLALGVQLTSLALLAANLFVVRALALRVSGGSRAVALAAAAFCAFYLPLVNWALQGMEVGLLALLVSGAALLALRALDAGRFPWAAYLLLGVATWVRPDGVVPLVAAWGFLALADRPRRMRHLAVGLAALAFFMGVQTGLRLAYYGDPLPNTYYLKMTGYPAPLRITRGLWALAALVVYANPFLAALPLGLALFRRSRAVGLLMVLTGAQVAYSVYVGGDAWEWWGGANRYVSVVMPLFLVLLAYALREGWGVARTRLERRRGMPMGARAAAAGWAALVVLALLSLNALKGPRSLREWALLDVPMHTEENARMVRLGLRLREITAPDAVLAVRWAGALPYFARRPALDLLGKTDRRVARLPMHGPPAAGFPRLVGFWPGHLKWDYAYSIGRLRPDLVINSLYDDELLAHLGGYRPVSVDGFTVYLRDDSRALR